jgi:hypothetical protein
MIARERFHLGLAGLLILVIGAAGCSRGISEGVHALTGSSGKAMLIQGDPVEVAKISTQYGTMKIEPITSDIGQACPEAFLNALPGAIEEQLRYRDPSIGERVKQKHKEDLGPFLTGPADRILVIKGRVTYYESGSLKEKAMGPLDEAICRVQFVDGANGTMLGEANCNGRVKSSVRTGPQELAKGIGKAIKKLLKSDEKK